MSGKGDPIVSTLVLQVYERIHLMKKILCPTDFSNASQNAIGYAAKLAQVSGAHLTLLNVQTIFDLAPQQLVNDGDAGVTSIPEALEAQALEITKAFTISCDAELQPGSASLASTIAERAKDFDLVVMGTNGPDDIYQFLTGSNAYKASIKTTIPVLLVPEGCGFSEIKKMVYAFDYLSARKLPMEQLKPWIRTLRCELSILQVMEEAYSEEFEEELKELQLISKDLYADEIKLTFDTIRSYEIAESIHSYVLRTQPDILALCAVHRNLLERFFHNSLIKNISAISSYPVFIFHE
jgi:nucleotide-binding universal stress UspA family protein